MSEGLKEAKLRPLLQKFGLDTTFKNYRPVSNLSFVSKLIEQVICEQLTRYIHSTGKMEPLQSAKKWLTQLKQPYSGSSQISSRTWTKIRLHVLFFLTQVLPSTLSTMSYYLTINHLRNRYGVTGQALEWICRYLTDRTEG